MKLTQQIIAGLAEDRLVYHQGMIVFGRTADGRILHIDSPGVQNGDECGCFCPTCNAPLIAKNGGSIMEHHFAHAAGRGCGTGGETFLHYAAKEVLAANPEISLPAHVVTDGWLADSVVYEAKLVRFDRLEIEQTVVGTETTIRPDAVGHLGERRLFIEITVTHRSSPQKLAMLRTDAISAVEIDLSSHLRAPISLGYLRELVRNTAKRSWLHSPIIEARLRDLREKARKYGDVLPIVDHGVVCPHGAGKTLDLRGRPKVFSSHANCRNCQFFGWVEEDGLFCTARTRVRDPKEGEKYDAGGELPASPAHAIWRLDSKGNPPANSVCPRCKGTIDQTWHPGEWTCLSRCVTVLRGTDAGRYRTRPGRG